MRVLVADFLFADAHKDMNINFISAVSQFAEIDVISLNGYYDGCRNYFHSIKATVLDIQQKKRSGPIGVRTFSLQLMKKTAYLLNTRSYDAVLCLGFETLFFGIGIRWFCRKPFFVFHHKNIDELTNRVKKAAFNIYKNKIYHVVFEEFFRNRLVNEIGVSSDRVFVIPHPAKLIANMDTDKTYDCIGLCNSNDEVFIKEAVQRENDFKEKGLHVLFRSKAIQKRDGAVEVINGFMEKEVYDELMTAGKTVFVPLPETYIYRLSGSIYDALSRKKQVYTTSKYYAEEYERRYPGICQHVTSVDQLIERLHNRREDTVQSISFVKFLEGHSVNTVSQEIEKMLNAVLEGNK